MLQLLLLTRHVCLRCSFCRLQTGNHRFLGYCALHGIRKLNPVLIQSLCQELLERGAVLGVGGLGRNDVVLRSRQISLLLQNVGRGRCTQPQFFHFRLVRLEVVLASGQSSLHSGAVVGQRVLSIDDLDSYLNVELRQTHLCLAIFEQRASLKRLRSPIAQRDVHVDSSSLIRARAVEHVGEDGSVAHGRYVASLRAKELSRAKRTLRTAEGPRPLKSVEIDGWQKVY